MTTRAHLKLVADAQRCIAVAGISALAILLTACGQMPPFLAAPASSAAPARVSSPGVLAPMPGLLDVLDRPAERALHDGLRAYADGQYSTAEASLGAAVAGGLMSARDRAAAHKFLAFMYCTSSRVALCEAAFKAAFQADPGFRLNRAESGHPLWGPVFRRVLGAS